MTNAESIIESLQEMDHYRDDVVTEHIKCPYTINDDCKYDGGDDHACCIGCKIKWLKDDYEEDEQ